MPAAKQSVRDLEIFDHLDDAVVVLDDSHRVVFCNGEAARFYGVSASDAVGQDLDSLFGVEAAPVPREEIWQMVDAEGSWRGEAIHVRRGGDRTRVDWSLRRFELVDRGLTGKVSVSRQIRASELAKSELWPVELPYRTLVENMNNGVGVQDQNGLVVYANRKLCEMLGYSRKELLGRPVTDFLDARNESILDAQLSERRRGSATSYGLSWLTKHGGELRTIMSPTPILDAEGAYQGTFAVTTDITERRQSERALRESEQRLRLMADTVEDVFWITDWISHRTLFVSQAYERVWGRTAESLYQSPTGWADAIHPDDRERAWEEFVGLEERDRYDEEYRVIRPDGSLRWIRDRGFPVRQPDGSVVQVVGIAQDITDHRQAEEQREALEAQIQHAQKLESLGVLAGGIAHDFNNLLMVVLGNASLALMGMTPESPARACVQDVETAAKRASELVKQMLAYSGKGQFVVERLNVNALVAEMVHLLEVSISKNATLEYHFADGVPNIAADATQVRQIIMNLITNASDAIGDKGGIISIATGAMECDQATLAGTYLDDDLPAGVYSYFEVSDTGEGMDPETRAKLFDPFFTTRFPGRGLGLAAVLGIVRGHGGAIEVHSEPNRGSRFKLLFPAMEPALGEGSVAAARVGEEPSGGGTVLLVDDDEMVRAVGKRMIENLGFEVRMAGDGRAALEVLAEHQEEILCVLLDLTMPRMGGEETLHELRRINENVVVILSSGYDETEIALRFAGKALAGFIQKPYTAAGLAQKLRESLRAGGQ
jgi:PAS domain S-box-containing protein